MSDDTTPTPPTDAGGSLPGSVLTTPCPLQPIESDELKSLHIDIGWTFTGGAPEGNYELTLNGQTFIGALNSGQIRIDNQLDSIAGSGELTITVTNGPIFKANMELCMPEIQSAAGLAQRLTNLGFYAGADGVCDGRMMWAIRAFKRVQMNSFTRNQSEVENNTATQIFLTAVQNVYGVHPNDSITSSLTLGGVSRPSTPCGMFGSHTYLRSRFEIAGATDDVDPRDAGNNGVWEGNGAGGIEEPVAGTFAIFLRAFDPGAGDSPIPNRVNLPQPIHMAQFVLFELGYWLVRGSGGWTTHSGTLTRDSFTPDGIFGRNTQWATREFQCHAKFANAAEEDLSSTERRYLPRLFALSPTALTGNAQYPENGRISGALKGATRNVLQAWADSALRCPVIVYASTDNNSATANGSDLTRIVKENLWLYDDHPNHTPRMYAIDYSGYYTIPAVYTGNVTSGGHSFPRPIVIGEYVSNMDGGPLSIPARHSWNSEHAEVRPDTMIGTGGSNGVGLTVSQLSTFKVVRTASHFECLGYFDCFNAYDDVTISFGPCHWTLARCSGAGAPNERREMPAFLSYMRNTYADAYWTCFGIFGLRPERGWPITMSNSTGTYNDRITIQTESGSHVLCGASDTNNYRRAENKYCKNWHVFYRFQMACRTSDDMRRAMWDFSRIRVRDILDKTFNITGAARRVGDYVTSEKGVAMLLRWHIFRPAHLFRTPSPGNPNHLQNILTTVITAYPAANQAREDAVLQELSNVGGPLTNGGLTTIHGWNNIPQQGIRPYYDLNLTNPTLSNIFNSFDFETP